MESIRENFESVLLIRIFQRFFDSRPRQKSYVSRSS